MHIVQSTYFVSNSHQRSELLETYHSSLWVDFRRLLVGQAGDQIEECPECPVWTPRSVVRRRGSRTASA